MQILNSYNPVILELDFDDIRLMHLAFYEYKNFLKRNNQIKKDKKRIKMRRLCRMITLVDFLI